MIQEKQEGPDGPHISLALAALASVYKYQGRYSEAEPLFEKVKMLLEKDPGNAGHPSLADCLGELADLFEKTDRQDKAQECKARAVKLRIEMGGA